MLSSFQRARAWLAIVAFTATFGLGLSASVHFGPNDDAACGEPSLAAGHVAPQFETAKAVPAATHCPFCHWQRVLSGASVVAADHAVIPLTALGLSIAPASRSVGSTAVDERPSRAPPA